jgi:hypothetical protein
MPGAEPQLAPAAAIEALRRDDALDQALVAQLHAAIDIESTGHAA